MIMVVSPMKGQAKGQGSAAAQSVHNGNGTFHRVLLGTSAGQDPPVGRRAAQVPASASRREADAQPQPDSAPSPKGRADRTKHRLARAGRRHVRRAPKTDWNGPAAAFAAAAGSAGSSRAPIPAPGFKGLGKTPGMTSIEAGAGGQTSVSNAQGKTAGLDPSRPVVRADRGGPSEGIARRPAGGQAAGQPGQPTPAAAAKPGETRGAGAFAQRFAEDSARLLAAGSAAGPGPARAVPAQGTAPAAPPAREKPGPQGGARTASAPGSSAPKAAPSGREPAGVILSQAAAGSLPSAQASASPLSAREPSLFFAGWAGAANQPAAVSKTAQADASRRFDRTPEQAAALRPIRPRRVLAPGVRLRLNPLSARMKARPHKGAAAFEGIQANAAGPKAAFSLAAQGIGHGGTHSGERAAGQSSLSQGPSGFSGTVSAQPFEPGATVLQSILAERFSPDVARWIEGQTAAVRLSGAATLAVTLVPEHLGRLSILVRSQKGGRLTVHLTADRPAAREFLQGQAGDLQRQLEAGGFPGVAVDVQGHGPRPDSERFLAQEFRREVPKAAVSGPMAAGADGTALYAARRNEASFFAEA